MTLFEQTNHPQKSAEPWNPPPWSHRLIGLGVLTLNGLALLSLPFIELVADRIGRWALAAPVIGLGLLFIVGWRIRMGDLVACRVWRVVWDQLATDPKYRFVRRLHRFERTSKGLLVAFSRPPPMTPDAITLLGQQVAATEGMRLESARSVPKQRRQPKHLELRFLK